MSISHEQLEPQTKLTYEQYVLFPNDGNRHEIINGRHYMNPAPVPRHQQVGFQIQFQLYCQLKTAGHQVFNAPIDVELAASDIVQPDLAVILKDNDIIHKTRIIGAPNLIVEILSPSTKENDRNLKRYLYEQAGVPEYWIVDPDECTVVAYKLKNGRYVEQAAQTEAIEFNTGKETAVVKLAEVWWPSP